MPDHTGIRQLRSQLTSLVRRAGAGERIVITIGGRAVAQLGPVEPTRRGDRPAEPDVRVDAWTGGRLDRALREVRGA